MIWMRGFGPPPIDWLDLTDETPDEKALRLAKSGTCAECNKPIKDHYNERPCQK